MLRGEPLHVELRSRDTEGHVHSEQQTIVVTSTAVTGRRNTRGAREAREGRDGRARESGREIRGVAQQAFGLDLPSRERIGGRERVDGAEASFNGGQENGDPRTLKVFAYGVARNRLFQAAKQVNARIVMVENLAEADVLVTLKSYYRKRRRLISDAEQRRIPVYILRANTVNQMERFLVEALGLEVAPTDPFEQAISETEEAIGLIRAGQPSVDLSPVNAAIRRYQHQMARQANLVSHSYGREPHRHVRIFNTRRQPS
jgi:hypothetical protein